MKEIRKESDLIILRTTREDDLNFVLAAEEQPVNARSISSVFIIKIDGNH
ncbi:hypothetical protein [Clostridium manihotivorum]|nr:hypothetical protein [Clostridium manihotivorum]